MSNKFVGGKNAVRGTIGPRVPSIDTCHCSAWYYKI